jgi:Skp family chaperone for outer membrane proteins
MMRIRTHTGTLLATLMIFAASQASAQVKFSGPAPKMAIVDVQAILRESVAAKSAREQMDSIARKEQATLAEEEKKLRAEDQALQQQRAILTPEVFAQRQQKLQTDVRNLQSKSRALRQTLDQGFRRTMDQIQLVLFDELRKLSGELDLNLILPRSQIVIATDDFDLTKPALERLNKRLPSIELNLKKGADAGKAK